MAATRIYLVRHGQSDKNTLDKARVVTAMQYDEYLRWQTAAPLTEKGAKQVKRAARWLAEVLPPPAHLYASTTKRTEQTAALLARQLDLSVHLMPDLNEVHSRGFPRWLPPLPLRLFVLLDRLALFIPWPHDETWYSGLARAAQVIRCVSGASSGMDSQCVVCISHHLFIRLMLLYARVSRGWHVARTDTSPAGISMIERG